MRDAAAQPLLVYCAAGIKGTLEALAHEFQKRHGIQVDLNFGPSQTLLANITVTSRGDVHTGRRELYRYGHYLSRAPMAVRILSSTSS